MSDFFPRLAKMQTVSYKFDKAKYQLYLRFNHNFQQETILIYILGKTGSTSLVKSMERDLGLNYNVYHTHFLTSNFLDQFEIDLKKNYPEANIRYVYHDLLWTPLFLRDVVKNKSPKWIVGSAREPVGRRVSEFFQLMHIREENGAFYCEDRGRKEFALQVEPGNIDPLIEAFFSTRSLTDESQWFRTELNEFLNDDIFENQVFDRQTGYTVLKSGENQLVLFRMEDLNKTYPLFLKEQFQLDVREMKLGNIGENKHYAGLYNAFKAAFRPSERYLNEAYNTPYAKYFYTPKEIEGFKNKWLRN